MKYTAYYNDNGNLIPIASVISNHSIGLDDLISNASMDQWVIDQGWDADNGWDIDKITLDIDTDVGRNIRRARESAGQTQKELATRIGVAQPRVAEWERGKVDPTGSTIIKIAAALGIEPGELLK